MAAISVVTFGSSPHKVNILQNNTRISNHNRDVLLVNKGQSLLGKDAAAKPLKRCKTKESAGAAAAAVARVSNPTPVAVARRNARERNRVKQVNNGFATLRQHIPPEIAAAFEQAGNGRGANKKLSKVETLRMAVEYIRSLEEILSDDSDSAGNSSGSSATSLLSYNSPSPLWSAKNGNYQFSLASTDDDDVSVNTVSPKSFQQYVRIPGTDTFQLVTTTLSREDEENIQPPLTVEDLSLVATSDSNMVDSPMMAADMMYMDTDSLSVFNPHHPAASLSPDMYSDHSLSPAAAGMDAADVHYGAAFTTLPPIEVLQSRNIRTHVNPISPSLSSQSASPRLSPGPQSVITIAPPPPANPLLYSPASEDLPTDETDDMIDAIDWWEHTQKLRHTGGPSSC